MIRPDLITVNATHVDFPAFRHYITQYRHMYDKVIVALSNHSGPIDLSKFIQHSMSTLNTIVLPASPITARDWRDVATHAALQYSNSPWVLFIEQDFTIYNHEKFFEVLSGQYPVVGFRDSNRLHPAFLLIKKEVLQRTSMDFAANPPIYDHFGHIAVDLHRQNIIPTILEDLDLYPTRDWEHLAGVTHNYTLLMNGQQVYYKPKQFAQYNRALINLPICQSVDFLPWIERASRL